MFVHNNECTDIKQHFESDCFVDAVRLIHRHDVGVICHNARRRSTVQQKRHPNANFVIASTSPFPAARRMPK
jgi:hypothetical protein